MEKDRKKVKGKETIEKNGKLDGEKSRNGRVKQSHVKRLSTFSTYEKGRRMDKCDI